MTKLKREAAVLKVREHQFGEIVPAATFTGIRTAWKYTRYTPGDGDHTAQPQRPNSCHKHIKSHGDRT